MGYSHYKLDNLITARDLIKLDQSTAESLEAALNAFPWRGTGIDWTLVPNSMTISRVGLSPSQERQAILKRTEFGKHDFAIAFYSTDVPPLGGRSEVVLANLDLIFWKAPGRRFIFPAEQVGAALKPILSTVLEYGNGDLLKIASRVET